MINIFAILIVFGYFLEEDKQTNKSNNKTKAKQKKKPNNNKQTDGPTKANTTLFLTKINFLINCDLYVYGLFFDKNRVCILSLFTVIFFPF